jgi:hypothetical protein
LPAASDVLFSSAHADTPLAETTSTFQGSSNPDSLLSVPDNTMDRQEGSVVPLPIWGPPQHAMSSSTTACGQDRQHLHAASAAPSSRAHADSPSLEVIQPLQGCYNQDSLLSVSDITMDRQGDSVVSPGACALEQAFVLASPKPASVFCSSFGTTTSASTAQDVDGGIAIVSISPGGTFTGQATVSASLGSPSGSCFRSETTISGSVVQKSTDGIVIASAPGSVEDLAHVPAGLPLIPGLSKYSATSSGVGPAQGSMDVLSVRHCTTLGSRGCFVGCSVRPGAWWQRPLVATPPASSPLECIPAGSGANVCIAVSLGDVFCHLNHSCNPNCTLSVDAVSKTCTVRVIQHVSADTELTIDYSLSGVYPLVFHCKCGFSSCVYRSHALPAAWAPVEGDPRRCRVNSFHALLGP